MDILLLMIIHLNQFGQYNMLDTSHIPSQQQSTFTFYATGNWQTWQKPRNAKMIEIFCLGGGGGGSQTGNITSTNGGGGGAGAGIVRGIIPAFLLPDVLHILVGKGGAGARTYSTAGGIGGISYIALQPSIAEQTLICKSSTTTAGGGGITGGGGVAPTTSVTSLSSFGNLGLFTAIAGVPGSLGGLATGNPSGNGASQTALSTSLVTGGAGGALSSTGGPFIGGSILVATVILTNIVQGGARTSDDNGGNGGNGYGTLQPFCGTGGAGGSDGNSYPGKGGDGWYGCGGGGCGGNRPNSISSAGNGGDGLVIITVIT